MYKKKHVRKKKRKKKQEESLNRENKNKYLVIFSLINIKLVIVMPRKSVNPVHY